MKTIMVRYKTHPEHTETNAQLLTLPAFQAFTRDVKSRCLAPPVTTEYAIVGSYG